MKILKFENQLYTKKNQPNFKTPQKKASNITTNICFKRIKQNVDYYGELLIKSS